MENKKTSDLRVGFHSIEMLLKLMPENIKQIFIPANRNDERIKSLINMAENASVSIQRKKSISQHPEAILRKSINLGFNQLKKFEESIKYENPTFLVIDNVIDPRNLGACIRSAVAANVDGIIINKHRCSPITSLVRQISSGGTEVAKIFSITNLVNTLKYFKKKGYLILGTSEHADSIYSDLDLNKPILAIVGSEEEGIRQKTLERCNIVCALSKNEIFNSLNVSVATGVLVFEIARQKY